MKDFKNISLNSGQALRHDSGQAPRLDSGQAMMTATILFLVVSVTVIFGLVGPILKQQKITSQAFSSRESYYLAEAGIEDIVYRLKTGKPVGTSEILSLGGHTVTTITTDTEDGKEITSLADANDVVRKLKTDIILGSGVSFHFGIQSGNGGVIMENTSSVEGNVYSNGPVVGSGPTNNIIRGGVVSAGPSGIINNLYATSSAYAHTISGAKVDGKAYYQTITNTTVGGTACPNVNCYPDSTDQSPATLPLSDEVIDEWKQVALDGGVISTPCPYKITEETTIGPIKIACDLEISGNNYTLTLGGNVWVEGDITVKNSPNVRVDAVFGNKGVAMIADKPSNPTTSGKISLENSAIFEGSGEEGSHVMLISQNSSAESGGAGVAIDVRNTVSGDLLVYAGHGEIRLANNINLKEVTAYKIRLQNTATVVYETGLTNLIFDTGPSGGYEILSWREIE